MDTEEAIAVTPGTVSRMADSDVGDGLRKYLQCVIKSKSPEEDEEYYGFQPDKEVTETEHDNSKTQHIVNPDVYDFSHPQRGYMVLIVNDRFDQYENRDGAEQDMIKSEEIARKLEFCILNRNNERNLKRNDMIHVLREAQAADHSNSDCFALIISTHGLESPNPRARGKKDGALICSDDEEVFTSTIIDMFNETQCPTLNGKPKLFFIQACRGDQLDDGADVKVEDKTCGVVMGDGNVHKRLRPPAVDELDSRPWTYSETALGASPIKAQRVSILQATSETIHKIYAPQPYPIVDTPSLKCDNDFLVLYAIPSGMLAWRNEGYGSWMIDDLHRVIMAYNLARQPANLLSLLTKVSAMMSKRKASGRQNKAVSVIEHTLTKEVIFTPKSEWVK